MNRAPRVALGPAACWLLLLSTPTSPAADDVVGVQSQKPQQGWFVEWQGAFLVPYTERVPGAEAAFQMVPVPGGELLLGSPAAEPGRSDDEGPQRRVRLAPFWIAAHEVTWAEYRPFMDLCAAFERMNDLKIRPVTDANRVDAVTAPSKLYEPGFTFAAGEDPRLPAVSMTQHSAKQYSKFISLVVGRFYRLPTEAEWEYACRAGTTTPYSFGDDPTALDAHAWHSENSDSVTHPVGGKEKNPWGLYDMHGNACEWVLDGYSEAGFAGLPEGETLTVEQALQKPTKVTSRVLRGGSALLDTGSCRSASRRESDDDMLKLYDPNTPNSPWWYASDEAQDIGFRLVRPFEPPQSEERSAFWDADHSTINRIVRFRIEQEGKGEWGLVDPGLPDALQEIERKKK